MPLIDSQCSWGHYGGACHSEDTGRGEELVHRESELGDGPCPPPFCVPRSNELKPMTNLLNPTYKHYPRIRKILSRDKTPSLEYERRSSQVVYAHSPHLCATTLADMNKEYDCTHSTRDSRCRPSHTRYMHGALYSTPIFLSLSPHE
jgi:hypothetical protein